MSTENFDEVSFTNTVKNIESKNWIKYFINLKNVRLSKKS